MAELSVNVVAANEEVFSGLAASVVAKTVDGEVGILPDRQPLLAILGEGEVRVTLSSGETEVFNASGGFISVDNNTVTIVSGQASQVG